MRRTTRALVAALALTGALAAPATAAPVYTDAQLASMDPLQQAKILDPLRAVANAAGELSIGRPPTGVTTTRAPDCWASSVSIGPTEDQSVWVAA